VAVQIVIRQATQTDTAALISCIDAAYDGYRVKGINLPDVTGGLTDDISLGNVWVASDGASVVGGLVLALGTTTAILKNVAVHPDKGGMGIGRSLIDKALEIARQHGCSDVVLTTHTEMPRNIALYRHLGWNETGRDGVRLHMARRLI